MCSVATRHNLVNAIIRQQSTTKHKLELNIEQDNKVFLAVLCFISL